ncbi:MAG: hypothetical protein ACKVT0_13395, partial [Planctomycetaceae bacterium]
RKLHEAVDADSELLSLLNEYCDLVNTLRPEQKDELRRTHDPHERLKLVGRYLYESGPPFDVGSPFRPGQPPSAADSLHRYAYRIIEFLDRGEKLSKQETEAVVSVLEEWLELNSNAAKAEPIWKRGYVVVDRIDRRSPRNSRATDGDNSRVFDKRLQERVIGAVQNPALVEKLKSFKSTQLKGALFIRELLLRSLINVIVEDLIADVPSHLARQNPPPPNDRGKAMANRVPPLTAEQQQKHAALMYRLTEDRKSHENELTAMEKLFRKAIVSKIPGRGDPRGENDAGPPDDRPEPRGGRGRPGFPPQNSDNDNRPPRSFGKGPRERPTEPRQP